MTIAVPSVSEIYAKWREENLTTAEIARRKKEAEGITEPDEKPPRLGYRWHEKRKSNRQEKS